MEWMEVVDVINNKTENYENCIYMWRNKVNQKLYIGQTKNFKKRTKEHKYKSFNENEKYHYNYPLHCAIRKYGIENFEICVLEKNLNNFDEMNEKEIYYIWKFDTLSNSKKGYNLSSGGNNGNPYAGKMEEEIGRKVICVTTGEVFNYIRKAEEKYGVEHGNVSACCKGRLNSTGVIDGKPAIWMYYSDYLKLSKEEINKIRNQEVPNGGRPKAIICTTTGEIYESGRDASRQTGVNPYNISACCNGKRKHAGKDKNGNKLTWMFLEDYEGQFNPSFLIEKNFYHYKYSEVIKMKEEVTYSFSKLSCFETCKKQYFYNYILKTEQKNNIYTLLGSTIHELVEALQKREMAKDVALEKIETDFELFEILGFKFPSEKTKENYQKSIRHFFKNFEPVHNKDFEIEKEVSFDLEGRKFIGYVDLLLHDSNGGVTIVDYKTSSKYTGDKLIHASRQLILYGIALENMGYKVNSLKFNMLKYASVAGKNGRTKTEQRCDLSDEPNEPLYVSVPYNDYTKQEALEWALDLIEQIESYTIFDTYEPTFNSFYCNTLCSFCDSCDECKNNKSKFFGGR